MSKKIQRTPEDAIPANLPHMITFDLPKGLVARLDRIAKTKGCSRATMIRRMLLKAVQDRQAATA